MYWNEENRLIILSDNGKTSRYTYNHAGERVVKSHGDLEGVYINGAPQGITFHENDEFTLYPASIISVNKNRFTKHYFIGSQRIASRIGSGRFNNVYGRNGSYVTAGQQDYAERLHQIESQREEYYKELGMPPGVPTMKGAYGEPENTGIGYNTIITELGEHSVPKNWEQFVVRRETDNPPGPPIIWSDPQNPEDAQPGYGYIADDTTEEETFFYHSDHLGSTSYITDDKGNITQYTAYLPYGELLVDEHSSSEDLPYKFNGKELDEETGLYYYGARYLNPVASIFLNTDRFMEKYPSLSPYSYCAGNPIKYIDVNGDSLWINHKGNDYLYQDGSLYNKDGSAYNGKNGKLNGYINKVKTAIDELSKTETGKMLVQNLSDSKFNYTIKYKGTNSFMEDNINRASLNRITSGYEDMAGSGGTIFWNPAISTSGPDVNGNETRPSFIGLGHEMAHAENARKGIIDRSPYAPNHMDYNLRKVPNDEINAVFYENKMRLEHGLPLRKAYTKDSFGNLFMPFIQ